MEKSPDAFRTISEVAEELDVPQHVLRFWETRFREIKPLKRGGGRRYYRPDDVSLLRGIRHLLYGEGYTIRGVQRLLREQGIPFVHGVWRNSASVPGPEMRGEAGFDEAEDEVSAVTDEADEFDIAAEPEQPELTHDAVPVSRDRYPAATGVARMAAPEPAAGLTEAEQARLREAFDMLEQARAILAASRAPA
ncbi:MAG TPA: MerR family transcriptional regulator [Xanthobacteraceae bacterium]|nr:MerR family transcriptional regulator [Xanthobacteraceae bacterium]